MDPAAAIIVSLSLVAAATVIGLAWRARTGRVRATDTTDAVAGSRDDTELAELLAFADDSAEAADPSDGRGPADADRPAPIVTLLQFSTDHCTSCGPTRRALQRLAADRPGVVHAEINLERHPQLASRLGIMQTPTTLIFDRAGTRRGRIGGAPRIPGLVATIAALQEEDHAVTI